MVGASGRAPPRGRRRLAFEHLSDPQPRTGGGVVRQIGRIEEAAGHDLAIRLREAVLPVVPEHIDRDMIARRDVAIMEDAVQQRRAVELDPPLLLQLAPQRFDKAFTNLDPAAGQIPAMDIAVLDQEHLVVGVEHDGADSERHAADQPPVEMKHPPDLRLVALA